jgi:Zn-dependent protease
MTEVPRRRPRGWVVARVAGIDLRLHPSLLVLLIAAGSGLFGSRPEALAWLLVVFGSVVIHELAHSLVARRRGVVVRDIVLLPIGGMSEFEHLPSSPGAQTAVAAAGPLASFGVGTVAAIFGFAFGDPVWRADVLEGGVLHDIAWLNLALGAFNLLPALPLDGGRLLRARFATRMDADEATVRAGRIGGHLAWALIVLGALVDFWLLLIGAFVLVVGRAESKVAAVRLELGDLRVAELTEPVGTEGPPAQLRVHGDDRVRDVLDELAAEGRATVLDRSERVVGLIEIEGVLRHVRHLDDR